MMEGDNAARIEISLREMLKSEYFSRGFADFASNGREAPYEYDDWTIRQQTQYENGRIVAAQMTALGWPMVIAPGWKSVVLLAHGKAHRDEKDIARRYLARFRSRAA